MVSTQFHKTIKVTRSDNGTKLFPLGSFFYEKGIMHQTSVVGTPQQNGQVECKHRHILNVAYTLCFQANLPKQF